MSNLLYTIIIYPLYEIVELCYRVFSEVFKNPGLSIIGVSLAITLLCLPLYAVAESWQEVERNKQKAMAYRLGRLKKAFKGDEQYMMISTYYRQCGYNPLMALRSTFGLLIQIPFFMAAYAFLSHNKELSGASFLFIKDMASPDALFSIGSFKVNILPIAMTAINIIAGAIYTRGFALREKLQIYGMALIFLVILYASPSGLVLYWTMNNVFSLIKNIFYKLREPLKAFHICASVVMTLAVIAIGLHGFEKRGMEKMTIFILMNLVVVGFPFIYKALLPVCRKLFISLKCDKSLCRAVFFQSAVALFLLTGLVIPSFLMTSSPSEYCYLEGYSNPLYFLYNSGLQAFGLFVFWPTCVYFLFKDKVKVSLSFLFFTTFFLGVINAFLFKGNYGVILPEVVFSEHKTFFPSRMEFLANSLTLLVAFASIIALFKFKAHKVLSYASTAFLLCALLTSGANLTKIGNFYKHYERPDLTVDTKDAFISLSKTEPNVMVIMMDRSTGYMTEHVMEEVPGLREKFTGFVKYPNTVSFAFWTIQGAVCLYGGYEYTPWEMNHRRELPMRDKHNEGISLQASIFSKEGFKCTVMDPPYPNYDKPPVNQAFMNLPDTTFRQCIGKYSAPWYEEHNFPIIPIRSRLIKRNFIYFSLFRISPMIARPVIHYQEFWGAKGQDRQDISHFIDNYSVLEYLPRLTTVDSTKPCFVLMDNELTHDQVFTQYPSFEPKVEVTDHGPSKWMNTAEFHVNAAGYKKLGEYFDYLKEMGVYDNTRIIIVADHGSNNLDPVFDSSDLPRSMESYNPVLMVKDFNARGSMKDDMEFMTHSDVPALAFQGLIDNPVNPYTGNAIKILSREEKNSKAIISFSGANSVNNTENNGYRIKDTDWYTVHDSIFRKENWSSYKIKG